MIKFYIVGVIVLGMVVATFTIPSKPTNLYHKHKCDVCKELREIKHMVNEVICTTLEMEETWETAEDTD